MKLTTLDEDLRIHQKLEDEPNDVGGLSAQALKEKFDQAGVTIQKYLNETHLPEEEQAVEEALSKAKAYADAKAKATDQGNMKAGVYDTKQRRQDVFDYTDGKIAELKTKKCGGAWVCSGACSTYACLGDSSILSAFEDLTDPDGLWSSVEKAFVVPEGGVCALVMARIESSKGSGTQVYLRIMVNGIEQFSRSLNVYTNSTKDRETVLTPVAVKSGDRIRLEVKSYRPEGSTSFCQIQLREAGVIIFA